MEKQKKCKELVGGNLKDRLQDLDVLWKLEQAGNDEGDEELGTLNEYGLCFDYVPENTFQGQRRGYFRYQLSWGGPSDEFRFYVNPNFSLDRIEYWFLNWFDGAKKILRGEDETFMTELWDGWFSEFAPDLIAKAED